MSETWQTIGALVIVGAALGFLVWRGLRRRGGSGCSEGGCGCSKGALKPRQK